MHSQCGLITEYLGDEWFDLTNVVTDVSEKEGMEAWLYDEDRWPSGSAGGKVTEEARYRKKSLYLYECDPDRFQWDGEVIRAFAVTLPSDGISIGGYREIPRTGGGVSSDTAWSGLGDGAPKVVSFRTVPDAPSSGYNSNTYIDTMNRAAVERFIETTHEEYRKRCSGLPMTLNNPKAAKRKAR